MNKSDLKFYIPLIASLFGMIATGYFLYREIQEAKNEKISRKTMNSISQRTI
jgi:hypothetical protein